MPKECKKKKKKALRREIINVYHVVLPSYEFSHKMKSNRLINNYDRSPFFPRCI